MVTKGLFHSMVNGEFHWVIECHRTGNGLRESPTSHPPLSGCRAPMIGQRDFESHHLALLGWQALTRWQKAGPGRQTTLECLPSFLANGTWASRALGLFNLPKSPQRILQFSSPKTTISPATAALLNHHHQHHDTAVSSALAQPAYLAVTFLVAWTCPLEAVYFFSPKRPTPRPRGRVLF